MTVSPELLAQRRALDAVDHALLELVRQRRALVADTFALKRRLGLPRVDPAREAELLADRRRRAEALGVPPALAEALLGALLADSHARPETSEAGVHAGPEGPADPPGP